MLDQTLASEETSLAFIKKIKASILYIAGREANLTGLSKDLKLKTYK